MLSGGNIPSYWAHSINVMKVAQGFSGLGYDTQVVSADSVKRRIMSREIPDLQRHYAVSREVDVQFLRPSLLAFLSGRTAHDGTYCRRAANFAKSGKFDLAYCRSYLIPYNTALAGIPTIIETHTTNYDHPALQKIYDVAELPAFKGLVTIHESIRDEHVKRGIPFEKTVVVETSVDTALFEIEDSAQHWKQHLEWDTSKRYVTYCGQLFPDKGIEVIIDAAKQMANRKDMAFHLIGAPAKWRRYWESLCRDQGITNIKISAFIANSDVPKVLKASDCLLMPYKLDMTHTVMDIHTTSPIKLFEYMAARRPIVATGIPSVRKVLQHRRNGLLATPGNTEQFRSLIEEALDDPLLSRNVAAAAWRDARKYTSKAKCRKILASLTGLECAPY